MVAFLDDLERKGGLRHQVNRCRETLRAIFAYAIERELITVNPVAGVSKRKVEIPRDRTLTTDELSALWRAIDKLPELPRAYFRVVLLTGARRNEVRCMTWSELVGQPLDSIVAALTEVAFDLPQGVDAETVRGRRRLINRPEKSNRKLS